MQFKIIFSVFCFLISMRVFADQTEIDKQAKTAISSIDRYAKMLKDYPNRDLSQTLRKTQRDILEFNNYLVTDKTETAVRLNLEVTIDYYSDECQRIRVPTLCKAAETQTAKYKKDYNAVYKPKKPVYPEIDIEKHTYNLNGKTYDLKTRKYTESKPAPPVVSGTAQTAVSATTMSAEEKTAGYSCEWDTSLPPRKLLYAPGCSGKSKLCIGHVKCNKNGWKINRLATCGDEFCTDTTATECAKQKTYGSKTSQAKAPEVAEAGSPVKGEGVSNDR